MAALPIQPGSGYPDLSTRANGELLPTLWSTTCTVKHYGKVIASEICNNTWNGEIENYGQKVVIPRTPTVQVFFADKDFDLIANGAYTTPTTPAAELEINQRHGYAFVYEDVDAYQAVNNNFERLSDDAVRQISIQQDKTILAGIPAQVATTNQGATAGINADTNLGAAGAPLPITVANAQSFLLTLKRVLTQLNVYTEGLKVVVGPKYRERLMQTNLQAANVTGDREGGIRTGYIGPFDGMELFESTFLPQFVDASSGNPICENVFVIHSDGLTWAMQYMLPEFIRLQNKFGTAFRGQCLWGFDVVEPTYIAVGYVSYA